MVLARFGRDPGLIAESRRRFAAHLADPARHDLAPDLIGPVAAISVANGGADAWEQALQAYRSAGGPQDQLRFLYALAETPVAELRTRTLELALGHEVRSQDAPFVMATLMGRRGSSRQAWDWIESHWDRVSGRIPPSLIVRVLEATSGFVEADLAGRVHEFCETTQLQTSPVRVQQVLERMDVNVAMAGRLRGAIAGTLGA
jgi:aminopeptidase N